MVLRNLMILVLVSVFLHGCGGAKEEILQYKIGKPVPMGKLLLTIERVDRDLDLGEWMGKNAQQEALVVFLQIENVGKHTLGFHVKELILHDASGAQYRGTPRGIGNQLNGSRVISMGDRMRGPMLYIVPKGIKGLKIHYVPKNMKNKHFVIDLDQ